MYDIEQQPATRKPARKPKRKPLPPACNVCHGKPWIYVLNTSYGHVEADRCDCERGKYLREADRKREAAI